LENPQFLHGKVHRILRYGPYGPRKNWIIKKLKMVRKYSNQLEEGKIPDFHGEKKGPENFPYVGGKEEILRTRKKSENKKVPQFSLFRQN
jgi:hypothetical protein